MSHLLDNPAGKLVVREWKIIEWTVTLVPPLDDGHGTVNHTSEWPHLPGHLIFIVLPRPGLPVKHVWDSYPFTPSGFERVVYRLRKADLKRKTAEYWLED